MLEKRAAIDGKQPAQVVFQATGASQFVLVVQVDAHHHHADVLVGTTLLQYPYRRHGRVGIFALARRASQAGQDHGDHQASNHCRQRTDVSVSLEQGDVGVVQFLTMTVEQQLHLLEAYAARQVVLQIGLQSSHRQPDMVAPVGPVGSRVWR